MSLGRALLLGLVAGAAGGFLGAAVGFVAIGACLVFGDGMHLGLVATRAVGAARARMMRKIAMAIGAIGMALILVSRSVFVLVAVTT